MSTIEKLDLRTPDFVSKNIENLAALFPNCITETAEGRKIDFDLLQQELSHDIVEGNRERYRLEWPGKREAIVTANLPTTKTLRPVREDSVDFDNTENLYIEGDNLEVLKLLQESYFGKIKMIYIDPPYNTGNDFVYKDNFAMDNAEWSMVNGEKDEYGTRLVPNPETSGRYHSDWLTMMYPRLKLACKLLTEDGVIFISIDDNEVHNLRKVCDEVFGERNFVGCFVWKRRSSSALDQSKASTDHEYVLVFHRGFFKSLIGTKKNYEGYSNPDNDPRGLWTTGDLTVGMNGDMRPNQYYDLIDPQTGKVYKANYNRVWSYTRDSMQKLIEENRVIFPEDVNKRPMRKRFANELNSETNPFSTWMAGIGMNTEGTRVVNSLFDDKTMFNYVKPLSLVQSLVNQVALENDIILDFFSGSATTAHAVMQLNAEDGGNRKFIMVQLPEQTDEKSEAYKAGYKNICEIGKERIRRAGKQIVNGQLSMLNEKNGQLEKMVNAKLLMVNGKYAFPDGVLIDDTVQSLLDEINNLQLTINHCDNGFRVYRLADSNMQDVYYRPQDYKQGMLDMFADNIKPDRTADDLLAQVMLDWGLPLSYKIEQLNINGKQVFRVAQDSLMACFDTGIDEAFAKEIAKEKPLRIVFRDSGFANDTAKINVQQLLKQLSPETEMKVI